MEVTRIMTKSDCSFYNNKIYAIGQTHYDSLGFAPKTNAAIQFPVPKTGLIIKILFLSMILQ